MVVKNMYLKGKGVRQRKRWFEVIESNMKIKGICEEDVNGRRSWMVRTRVADTTI